MIRDLVDEFKFGNLRKATYFSWL